LQKKGHKWLIAAECRRQVFTFHDKFFFLAILIMDVPFEGAEKIPIVPGLAGHDGKKIRTL
jgi:hypothetical protein